MPGAHSANSSCPKYDWPAPAATIRLSNGSTSGWPSGRRQRTSCASRSNAVTSAISTVTLRWRLSTSRVAGATAPSDRIPVATW